MSEDVAGRVRRCRKMSLRCPGSLAIFRGMKNHRSTSLNRPPLTARSPSPTAGLTRDEVITATEVAELLQLRVSTVYYLARRGDLPAHRLGRTWRFLRPRLEELLHG